MKTIGRSVYGAITIILLCIAALAASSGFNIPNGIKLYIVQSGSMEPSIHIGSMVIIKPGDNYQIGDVVTFKNLKETVTHRIFETRNIEGQISYVLKGDANDAPDTAAIGKELVLGKVILSIPLIGFAVNFAKTLPGLLILIVIPATLIIYSELMTIKKEAIKLMFERKQRRLTLKEKVEEKIGEEVIAVEKALKKDV